MQLIARPNAAKEKRRKRIIYASVAVVVLIGITIGLAKLKPAAPTVERNLVWIDTVKRGPMVRQVRGLGTLVPEEIRWIAARTQGRVDKIIIRPGTPVQPGTLILELSNPDVVSAAANARSQLLAAEAEAKDLIEIGAYVPGTNPVVDRAVSLRDPILGFLRQDVEDKTDSVQAFQRLAGVLQGAS